MILICPRDVRAKILGIEGSALADFLGTVEIEVVTGEPVPEPATIALLGIGLVGLAGAEVRRRRKKKAVDG